MVFGVVGTQIAEYCIHHNYSKKSTVRRIGGMFLATTGIYFLLLGLLPCVIIDKAIIALLIFSSFRSGTFVSLLPAFHDISPTYQDTLFSVSMVVGFIPGFVVPAIMGVVGKETRKDWLIIFVITAVVIFISVGFFIFSIRPKIQGFDDVAIKREKLRLEKKLEDVETELEPPPPPKEVRGDHFTPQAAKEYAERVWPDGMQNVKMSIWDKANTATITKISQRVKGELSGTQKLTALEEGNGKSLSGIKQLLQL